MSEPIEEVGSELIPPVAYTKFCTCGVIWSWPMNQHRPGVDVVHEIEADDPRNRWSPLTIRERFRICPVVHDLWFVLTYYTGIRDRMRCPSCKSVGTWKMHGSLVERWVFKDLAVRRWMCKWCGYYIGPRGRVTVYPDRISNSWALPEPPAERQLTPAEVVKEKLGAVWPWRG